MDTVGEYDARANLPRLLDEVADGRSYVITKHGEPVARLAPIRSESAPEELIDAIRFARTGVRRGLLSVREMIDEARR
ncbi:MAG: type II toxin-antitoxin system Phd/YefM family antitoxin [Jiangellaceae bacterium]